MKTLIIALALLSSNVSFAKPVAPTKKAVAASSVSVNIDGKVYSCTEGGAGSPCAEAMKTLRSKYNACVGVYNQSYCYSSVVDGKTDKSCAEGVQLCSDACTAGYNASYCYSRCY